MIERDVEIVAGGETHVVTLETSVLALDAALVDMARQRLGIDYEQFQRGEVLGVPER
jgi:hypothetical protein